jgi:hypothetical protein
MTGEIVLARITSTIINLLKRGPRLAIGVSVSRMRVIVAQLHLRTPALFARTASLPVMTLW